MRIRGIELRWGVRCICACLLTVIFAAALLANVIAPASYETQFREDPGAPPSSQFLLGTDELGRDRLSRLLYGSRISLLLAPAAAALATAIGLSLGVAAGCFAGMPARFALGLTDLVASTPSLLLLLFVQGALASERSTCDIGNHYVLSAWDRGLTSGVRVFAAAAASASSSDYIRQARALGCPTSADRVCADSGGFAARCSGPILDADPTVFAGGSQLGNAWSWRERTATVNRQSARRNSIVAATRQQPAVLAPAALLLLVLLSLQGLLTKERA